MAKKLALVALLTLLAGLAWPACGHPQQPQRPWAAPDGVRTRHRPPIVIRPYYGYYVSPYYGYYTPYWYRPYYYGYFPSSYGNYWYYGYPSPWSSVRVYARVIYGPGYYYSFYYAPPVSPRSTSPGSSSSYPIGVSRYFVEPSDNRATVHLRVPDGSKVWFDGVPTEQNGSDRVFVSPPLENGTVHTYGLKASWQEHGREVTREQQIDVQAGHVTLVHLID